MLWSHVHGSEFKVLFRFSIHHITSHLTSPMSNITLAESSQFERWWRKVVHEKILKVQAVSPANLICLIAVANVQYHFRKLIKIQMVAGPKCFTQNNSKFSSTQFDTTQPLYFLLQNPTQHLPENTFPRGKWTSQCNNSESLKYGMTLESL